MNDRTRKRTSSWLHNILILVALGSGPGTWIISEHINELKAEQRLGMMFDALSEATEYYGAGYWYWDTHTEDIYWSPKLREVYGVQGPQVNSYADWLAVVHPEDTVFADQICAEALASRSGYKMHYRVIGDDGQTRYVVETAAMTADGRFMVGMVAPADEPEEPDLYDMLRVMSGDTEHATQLSEAIPRSTTFQNAVREPEQRIERIMRGVK